ncbi:MAG: L-serine ammonia-lyase [Burkholderiales bacterium]|jgi:L-serine dehydratase|nr:L-serine ammonia-lyase [Burkholderiales bacterium]
MLNALDMFSIGIGPSSSHTIGPMKAALLFIDRLKSNNLLDKVFRLEVHLFGSLALTGEGHGTVFAVLNGLCGEDPKTVNPDKFMLLVEQIKTTGKINLAGIHHIGFNYDSDMLLHKKEFLPQHANGIRFIALGKDQHELMCREYFSVGGGFVLDQEQIKEAKLADNNTSVPYVFSTADELMALCLRDNLTIAALAFKNHLAIQTEEQIRHDAMDIVNVMHESVLRGISTPGTLPGGLNVRRRAPGLYEKINESNLQTDSGLQRLAAMAYAIGVNEENAAFSKIVTAPTNGAAGTIPGVLEYYRNFCEDVTDAKLIDFILTAGTIGLLYKFGASISAAEVGCQGEIGVACSMAAGALTAVLGGSVSQVEKAAEIAMEHSLGMTCDPIGGLVQIPCIERNGVAASRAIDIAKLVLLEPEPGRVSLDSVIKTMMQTGRDMQMQYKETSLGGLAVNVANC